jgi:hypothetical protein
MNGNLTDLAIFAKDGDILFSSAILDHKRKKILNILVLNLLKIKKVFQI